MIMYLIMVLIDGKSESGTRMKRMTESIKVYTFVAMPRDVREF